MCPRCLKPGFQALLAGVVSLAAAGCQSHDEPAAGPGSTPAAATPSKHAAAVASPTANEIPAAELSAVMEAHFQGSGYMEQYEYGKAAKAFREVRKRAPGWVPGAINLAIALLNMTGQEVEAAKQTGGGAALGNFDEALQLLSWVFEQEPDNIHAHYCTGIILEQQGDLTGAHKHFQRVTELDPHDATAWYWSASTVTDPGNSMLSTSPQLAKEQAALYSKALEVDPYLTQAVYKLSFASRLAGEPQKQQSLLERWKQINPDRPQPVPGPGNSAAKVYGEMGKYATVISPFPRPATIAESEAIPPKFEPAHPLDVKLAAGDRWAGAQDLQGNHALIGRVRDRFGAAVATFDANGDGKLDIYLAAAVVGPKGLRDALLLNQGDGHYVESGAVFGLPLDQASLGVAAADFDADRQIDLFLTGVGKNLLLRNKEGKGFEDQTQLLKAVGPPAISLMARWLDLDQDGDLDLYVVNYCAVEHAAKAFLADQPPPPGIANTVYRNDGQPTPTPGSPAAAWAPLAVAWDNMKTRERSHPGPGTLDRRRCAAGKRSAAHRHCCPRSGRRSRS